MYFVSPVFLAWSQQFFKRPNLPQENGLPQFNSNTTNERTLIESANKHHLNAVNNFQKVKRIYFLERGPFL